MLKKIMESLKMAKKANGKKKPVSKKVTTSAKKAAKKPTTKSKVAARKEVKAKVVAKKAAKPLDKKVAKKAVPPAAAKIDKKKAAKLEAEAKKAAALAAKKNAKTAKPEVKVEPKKAAKEIKTDAKPLKAKGSDKHVAEKTVSSKELKGKKGKKEDLDETLIEFQEEIIIEEIVDDFDDEEFKDAAPKAGPRALAKMEDPEDKELPAVKVKALSEEMDVTEALNKVRSMDFFLDEGDECIEKGCDSPATTGNYCRYHYIRNWQDIKKREGILKEGKLHQFIEELFRKYSQKQVEAMQADLSDDKNFFGVLKELNIELEDESFEEADDELLDDDTDIAFETKPGKLGFIED
jgi:hypothetical protein